MKFHAPARLGDVVVIETVCESVQSASLRVRQKASRDGAVLCEGAIRIGFVDPGGKPRRQPEDWRKKFSSLVCGETI